MRRVLIPGIDHIPISQMHIDPERYFDGDYIEGLLDPTNDEYVFIERTAAAIRGLGFDYFSYTFIPSQRPAAAQLRIVGNHPEWHNLYRNMNHFQRDPLVQRCLLSSLPIVWGSAELAPVPALFADACRLGWRYGWGHSVRDHQGAIGIFVLARASAPMLNDEVRGKNGVLLWLSHATHFGVSQFISPAARSPRARLTEREIEVLSWSADGKSASDVAEILGITERTVRFHVTQIMNKLEVNNKTAAVVRAARIGII